MPQLSRSGGTLHYGRLGSGPPLVMLHGGLVDSRGWLNQEPLAKYVTLVTPDTRNAGRSLGFEGEVTMDDLIADVVAVARDSDLGTFHLLGFSMGALVAQAFALRHASMVRSLALVSSTARDLPLAQNENGQSHVERAFSSKFRASNPAFIESYSAMVAANEESGYARTRAVWAEAPGTADVRQLTVPTAIMHARRDGSLPYANAVRLHQLIEGSELMTFEAVGHTIPIEAPTAFNRAVRDFVARVERRSPAPEKASSSGVTLRE